MSLNRSWDSLVITRLKIRKYGLIIGTSFQNSLAYGANFLFDTFFYAFVLFIFLQLWRAIYGHGGAIAGYSLNQMIWYCVITEMIAFSGSNIFYSLNEEIKNGNIAYALNKPYHYISYQLANGLGLMGIKIIINGLFGVFLGLLYIGPLNGFHVNYLPLIILLVCNGLILNFFAITCLGLTAFWLEENTAFFWIYQKLSFMLGLFLPVEFFPGWLQKLALVLPFPYVFYGPARLAVAFSWEKFWPILWVQLGYSGLFLVLALLIYRKGVKSLHVNGG